MEYEEQNSKLNRFLMTLNNIHVQSDDQAFTRVHPAP